MSRRKMTRVLAVVSTLALAGSLLAACAGTKEGGKEASGIPTISILVPQFTTEPIKPDNAVVKKIEAYTKSKLELTWVPSVAYDDKLSITISSGSMPKVLTVINNKASYIVNGARSGQFWEVGPYLKDYPNLSKLNKDVLNNISIDGKVYGLYRYRPLTRDGFVIRKDWLNNLGLQPPKSVDDIYNVLKAFTTQDPDQNGKNDTFGLSLEAGLGAFNDILVYNGGFNEWGIVDDKVTPAFMTKEYVETLNWFKKLYDEKLMNSDFAITKDGSPNINQGKAGVKFGAVDDVWAKYKDLASANPKAELDVVSRIQGPAGEKTPGAPGYGGVMMFPKSSVKTEAELKEILGFFDKLSDQTIRDLLVYGIEGVHHTKENNVRKITNQDLYNAEVNPLNQLMVFLSVFDPMDGDTPVVAKAKKMISDNAPLAVVSAVNPFTSDTQTEKGEQLTKMINDARTKYIMGEIDEAGWNKAVEEWTKGGGNKVIEEYNAQYALVKNE